MALGVIERTGLLIRGGSGRTTDDVGIDFTSPVAAGG